MKSNKLWKPSFCPDLNAGSELKPISFLKKVSSVMNVENGEKIVIEFDDNQKICMLLQDAKSLYFQLKEAVMKDRKAKLLKGLLEDKNLLESMGLQIVKKIS